MSTETTILEPKTEAELLKALRQARKSNRHKTGDGCDNLTLGQRVADVVASSMGSWTFIIIQSVILLIWVILNVLNVIKPWDPYPFILLNLALSFQAAYAAPIIMMSQNRQQDIDRKTAQHDYEINVKAELEIELLHQKLDQLREMEILNLTQAVKELTEIIHEGRLQSPQK